MSASRPLLIVALWGLAALQPLDAQAADSATGPLTAELHGDVKSFFVASWPPPEADWPAQLGMNPEPEGSGIVDFRLKASAELGSRLRLEVHHDLAAFAQTPSAVALEAAGQSSGSGFGSSGVGRTAPEAVDLTWEQPELDDRTGEGNLFVRGRIDRLVLEGSFGQTEVALGRQAIGFGSGMFFTPLDLVNPFFPGTIDTEYRPGVDALRVDQFIGMTGRIGVAAAYAGDWDLGGTVLQATGQGTIGVTDVLGLVGSVHGDGVVGAGFVSSVGPVGIHGDVSVTAPDMLHEDSLSDDRQCYSIDPLSFSFEEDAEGSLCQDLDRITEPYVRAVVGADVRPSATSFVSAEVYLQTFGETDSSEAFLLFLDERYARGELWQTGMLYGALSANQEITPIVSGSVAVIANLTDPSALIAPGLSWGVSDEATLVAGMYLGVGEKPGEPDLSGVDFMAPDLDEITAQSLSLNSELGALPPTAYLQLKTYF